MEKQWEPQQDRSSIVKTEWSLLWVWIKDVALQELSGHQESIPVVSFVGSSRVLPKHSQTVLKKIPCMFHENNFNFSSMGWTSI